MWSYNGARLLHRLYYERLHNRFKKFLIGLHFDIRSSLPTSVDNDSISIRTSDPSSSAKISKELPDEVDYNSDCEFLSEAEKRDHDSRSSRETRNAKIDSSSHMTVSEMIPVQVQSSSAQVSDNWETLQVRYYSPSLLFIYSLPSQMFQSLLFCLFCSALLCFVSYFITSSFRFKLRK